MNSKPNYLNILYNNNFNLKIINFRSIGTIDSYISNVNKLPILTAEKEFELGFKLKFDKINASRDLIISHLRLVVSISRQYLGYGISHSDLIQEGNIGILKAVRRFNPNKGVRLVSFAIYWIKSEINNFIIRNCKIVKIATTKSQRKLFFNLKKIKTNEVNLGKKKINDIAIKLRVSLFEIKEMELRINNHDINLEYKNNVNEKFSSINYFLFNKNKEPLYTILKQSKNNLKYFKLIKALNMLDIRSRIIIKSRWLKENKYITLQMLSKKLGISIERIRQIEIYAIKKMKYILTNIHRI